MAVLSGGDGRKRSRPATTPEARESKLVSLAMDLVETRLRAGTATAQETTHFLKLGSSREVLEQERLWYENQLSAAKREALQNAEKSEERFKEAINAMRSYQGQDPIDYGD